MTTAEVNCESLSTLALRERRGEIKIHALNTTKQNAIYLIEYTELKNPPTRKAPAPEQLRERIPGIFGKKGKS